MTCRKPTISLKSTLPYISNKVLGRIHNKVLIISFRSIRLVVLYSSLANFPKIHFTMSKLLVVIGITGQQVRSSNHNHHHLASCSDITGRLRRKPLCQRARMESPWHIAGPIQSTILDGQRHRSRQSRPKRQRLAHSSLPRRPCHFLCY